MTCGYKIFPQLEYKRPHENSRGPHGIGKHYKFIMDPMLGKGKCEIFRIPCACLT